MITGFLWNFNVLVEIKGALVENQSSTIGRFSVIEVTPKS